MRPKSCVPHFGMIYPVFLPRMPGNKVSFHALNTYWVHPTIHQVGFFFDLLLYASVVTIVEFHTETGKIQLILAFR